MRRIKTGITLAVVTLLTLTLWVPLSQGAQPPPYTRLVSRTASGTPADADSEAPSVSVDGRYVAFHSNATDLVTADSNNSSDIFVLDRFLGQMERVSVSSAGAQANGHSQNPAISPDGRWVVFESDAANLVSGDTNDLSDIFLHDRQTDQTTRVNHGPGGVQAAGGDSTLPDISNNGDRIVYQSDATNLIANDGNSVPDIFMYSRVSGLTERVSVSQVNPTTPPNGSSTEPRISASGQFVTFASVADNLVANDDNDYCGPISCADVFVRNLNAATTEMTSLRTDGLQANNASLRPDISSDGRWVVFDSNADNLDTALSDTNFVTDIFLHDRSTDQTTRVSLGAGNTEGIFPSISARISDDGNWIAFTTASDLVASDTNFLSDIYLRLRTTGAMVVASLPEGGGEANGSSDSADLSGDGQRVVFSSFATNLAGGSDTNDATDIFIRTYLEDDATPTPTLAPSSTGTATAGPSVTPTSTPVTPTVTRTPGGGPPTLTPTGQAGTRTPTPTRTRTPGPPVIYLPIIRR